MIGFSLFGIPVRIHPFFWILCALISWPGGRDLQGVIVFQIALMRTGMIFFSIYLHELGHALAAKHFGLKTEITLHGLGGIAQSENKVLTRFQNFIIVAAGPLASFIVIISIYMIRKFGGGLVIENISLDLLWNGLSWAQYINVFWLIINLLPIFPMDGGQMLHYGVRFKNISTLFLISFITSILMGVLAFSSGQIYVVLFMVYFAIQNFKAYKGDGMPHIW